MMTFLKVAIIIKWIIYDQFAQGQFILAIWYPIIFDVRTPGRFSHRDSVSRLIVLIINAGKNILFSCPIV